MKSLYTLFLYFLLPLFFFDTSANIDEKEIVVVVASFNNKDWYERNLTSILDQKYHNYMVKYYNDNSNDETGALVQAFINKHDKNNKITLINNSERHGALFNYWQAIHSSPDHVIIVQVDGDDWFPHPDVLKKVNQIYQDPSIWMTYGQYVRYPSNEIGGCRPIPEHIINENQYRSAPFVTSHLRTFYASLFKQIKLQDFLYRGDFFKVCNDVAFMFPCLEMAGHHVRFIPEILYIYNIATPLNDSKINRDLQIYCTRIVRQRSKYQPLNQLPHLIEKYEPYTADLIVFSYNRPLQLYSFLESVERHVTGIESISVLYHSDNDDFEAAYQQVEQDFSYIEFVRQSTEQPHNDFKSKTIELFSKAKANYLLFAVDDIVVIDSITIKDCIKAMEKTHAYGFYLRLGKNLSHCYMTNSIQKLPRYLQIGSNIIAWQFKYSEGDWRYPNNLDMTLYRKQDIHQALLNLTYTLPNSLEGNWSNSKYLDLSKVGLCFETTKIINLPLNKVRHDNINPCMNGYTPETLLEVFNNNLKMDIKPLYKIKNKSVHMEYEPTFIER